MNTKLVKDIIKQAENFSNTKYKCDKGVWTIANGRTFLSPDECTKLGVNSFEELDYISYEDAEWLLDRDILRCVGELQRNLSYFSMLPSEVQIVLVDVCFNIGITELMKFKKTLGYISRGEYDNASHELLDSDYCSDVKGRALRNSIALASGKFVDLETCKLMWKQLKVRV